MNITKKRLYISGMSCINCQNKIENKLKNTIGIEEATVSYNTGVADIKYNSDIISLEDIAEEIDQLGYEVLQEDEKAKNDMTRTISLLVIMISLYILFQQLGVLNLLAPSQLADTKMGYGMLFVVGVITSVHCVAMCGGINLSQSLNVNQNDINNANKLKILKPAFLYNLGRVISYTVIGFILGLVGMLIGGFFDTGISALFQGVIKIIAGIFMVVMGINMLNIFPALKQLNVRPPQFLVKKINKKKRANNTPIVVGMLNGLMPCGPLQSMQIVALASENAFVGAFSMFMFSLGTVPLMLGFGSLISVLGKKFSQKVMSVGAVFVVVLGLSMLSQGGSLSGLFFSNTLLMIIIVLSIIGVIVSSSFSRQNKLANVIVVCVVIFVSSIMGNHLHNNYSTNESQTALQDVQIIDGVQVVSSTLDSGKYPSITVQAGVPVKWIIDAPKGSINGCNYKMLMKEYGIEHTFSEGENVIEFTPTKSGTFQYTCWMGMIYGNVSVLDK